MRVCFMYLLVRKKTYIYIKQNMQTHSRMCVCVYIYIYIYIYTRYDEYGGCST